MAKYEYKVINIDTVSSLVEFNLDEPKSKEEARERFEAWLNSHGQEGWEFVGKGGYCYIFKRKVF